MTRCGQLYHSFSLCYYHKGPPNTKVKPNVLYLCACKNLSLQDNDNAMLILFSYIRIDLPIITDQFDASLVILRRRFCWSYEDILYKKQTVSHSSGLSISSQATAKLLSADVNLGEKMLYEKVYETWWKSLELTQQGFWEEVGHAEAIKHSGVHIGFLEKGLD